MPRIDISVRPYVCKFILSRYECAVWEINKQERIGKVLYSMLEHMPKFTDKTELKLGAKLDIDICRDYYRNKGIYLSNQSIIEFNDFVYLELIEEIAKYTHGVQTRLGMKKYLELYIRHNRAGHSRVHVIKDPDLFQYLEKREIIYDILQLYDITEDDLPFETIKKALQRLKLPLLRAC